MPARSVRPETAEVAIVAMNPETLDGLHAYLTAAGVLARCSHEIEDCTLIAARSPLAFVLFPDDYPLERVVRAISVLTSRRPKAMAVLVTAHPKRFQKLAEADTIIVVPRPVWGWSILDAVRAHLDAHRHCANVEVARER